MEVEVLREKEKKKLDLCLPVFSLVFFPRLCVVHARIDLALACVSFCFVWRKRGNEKERRGRKKILLLSGLSERGKKLFSSSFWSLSPLSRTKEQEQNQKPKKPLFSFPLLSFRLFLFRSTFFFSSSSFRRDSRQGSKTIPPSCDQARCSEEEQEASSPLPPPLRLCRCHQRMARLGEVTPPRGPPRRAPCAPPRWRHRHPLSELPCARAGPPCPRRSAPAGPCL